MEYLTSKLADLRIWSENQEKEPHKRLPLPSQVFSPKHEISDKHQRWMNRHVIWQSNNLQNPTDPACHRARIPLTLQNGFYYHSTWDLPKFCDEPGRCGSFCFNDWAYCICCGAPVGVFVAGPYGCFWRSVFPAVASRLFATEDPRVLAKMLKSALYCTGSSLYSAATSAQVAICMAGQGWIRNVSFGNCSNRTADSRGMTCYPFNPKTQKTPIPGAVAYFNYLHISTTPFDEASYCLANDDTFVLASDIDHGILSFQCSWNGLPETLHSSYAKRVPVTDRNPGPPSPRCPRKAAPWMVAPFPKPTNEENMLAFHAPLSHFAAQKWLKIPYIDGPNNGIVETREGYWVQPGKIDPKVNAAMLMSARAHGIMTTGFIKRSTLVQAARGSFILTPCDTSFASFDAGIAPLFLGRGISSWCEPDLRKIGGIPARTTACMHVNQFNWLTYKNQILCCPHASEAFYHPEGTTGSCFLRFAPIVYAMGGVPTAAGFNKSGCDIPTFSDAACFKLTKRVWDKNDTDTPICSIQGRHAVEPTPGLPSLFRGGFWDRQFDGNLGGRRNGRRSRHHGKPINWVSKQQKENITQSIRAGGKITLPIDGEERVLFETISDLTQSSSDELEVNPQTNPEINDWQMADDLLANSISVQDLPSSLEFSRESGLIDEPTPKEVMAAITILRSMKKDTVEGSRTPPIPKPRKRTLKPDANARAVKLPQEETPLACSELTLLTATEKESLLKTCSDNELRLESEKQMTMLTSRSLPASAPCTPLELTSDQSESSPSASEESDVSSTSTDAGVVLHRDQWFAADVISACPLRFEDPTACRCVDVLVTTRRKSPAQRWVKTDSSFEPYVKLGSTLPTGDYNWNLSKTGFVAYDNFPNGDCSAFQKVDYSACPDGTHLTLMLQEKDHVYPLQLSKRPCKRAMYTTSYPGTIMEVQHLPPPYQWYNPKMDGWCGYQCIRAHLKLTDTWDSMKFVLRCCNLNPSHFEPYWGSELPFDLWLCVGHFAPGEKANISLMTPEALQALGITLALSCTNCFVPLNCTSVMYLTGNHFNIFIWPYSTSARLLSDAKFGFRTPGSIARDTLSSPPLVIKPSPIPYDSAESTLSDTQSECSSTLKTLITTSNKLLESVTSRITKHFTTTDDDSPKTAPTASTQKVSLKKQLRARRQAQAASNSHEDSDSGSDCSAKVKISASGYLPLSVAAKVDGFCRLPPADCSCGDQAAIAVNGESYCWNCTTHLSPSTLVKKHHKKKAEFKLSKVCDFELKPTFTKRWHKKWSLKPDPFDTSLVSFLILIYWALFHMTGLYLVPFLLAIFGTFCLPFRSRLADPLHLLGTVIVTSLEVKRKQYLCHDYLSCLEAYGVDPGSLYSSALLLPLGPFSVTGWLISMLVNARGSYVTFHWFLVLTDLITYGFITKTFNPHFWCFGRCYKALPKTHNVFTACGPFPVSEALLDSLCEKYTCFGDIIWNAFHKRGHYFGDENPITVISAPGRPWAGYDPKLAKSTTVFEYPTTCTQWATAVRHLCTVGGPVRLSCPKTPSHDDLSDSYPNWMAGIDLPDFMPDLPVDEDVETLTVDAVTGAKLLEIPFFKRAEDKIRIVNTQYTLAEENNFYPDILNRADTCRYIRREMLKPDMTNSLTAEEIQVLADSKYRVGGFTPLIALTVLALICSTVVLFWSLPCGYGTADPFCVNPYRSFHPRLHDDSSYCSNNPYISLCISTKGLSTPTIFAVARNNVFPTAFAIVISCAILYEVLFGKVMITLVTGFIFFTSVALASLFPLAYPLVHVTLAVIAWKRGLRTGDLLIAMIGLVACSSLHYFLINAGLYIAIFLVLTFSNVSFGFSGTAFRLHGFGLLPCVVTPNTIVQYSNATNSSLQSVMTRAASAPNGTILAACLDAHINNTNYLYLPRDQGVIIKESGLRSSIPSKFVFKVISDTTTSTGFMAKDRNGNVTLYTTKHALASDRLILKFPSGDITCSRSQWKVEGENASLKYVGPDADKAAMMEWDNPSNGLVTLHTCTGTDTAVWCSRTYVSQSTAGDSGSPVTQGGKLVGIHYGSNKAGYAVMSDQYGSLSSTNLVRLSEVDKFFSGPMIATPSFSSLAIEIDTEMIHSDTAQALTRHAEQSAHTTVVMVYMIIVAYCLRFVQHGPAYFAGFLFAYSVIPAWLSDTVMILASVGFELLHPQTYYLSILRCVHIVVGGSFSQIFTMWISTCAYNVACWFYLNEVPYFSLYSSFDLEIKCVIFGAMVALQLLTMFMGKDVFPWGPPLTGTHRTLRRVMIDLLKESQTRLLKAFCGPNFPDAVVTNSQLPCPSILTPEQKKLVEASPECRTLLKMLGLLTEDPVDNVLTVETPVVNGWANGDTDEKVEYVPYEHKHPPASTHIQISQEVVLLDDIEWLKKTASDPKIVKDLNWLSNLAQKQTADFRKALRRVIVPQTTVPKDLSISALVDAIQPPLGTPKRIVFIDCDDLVYNGSRYQAIETRSVAGRSFVIADRIDEECTQFDTVSFEGDFIFVTHRGRSNVLITRGMFHRRLFGDKEFGFKDSCSKAWAQTAWDLVQAKIKEEATQSGNKQSSALLRQFDVEATQSGNKQSSTLLRQFDVEKSNLPKPVTVKTLCETLTSEDMTDTERLERLLKFISAQMPKN